MTARFCALAFGWLMMGLSAEAQPEQKPTTYGPSALADHAARMEGNAQEYLKEHSAGAGWLVDVDAFISSKKAEYDALGKYIILVFAAFSDNRAELPLKKVYSGNTLLNCLPPVWHAVPAGSATFKADGKFRADLLCALPVAVAVKGGDVTAYFSNNRKGFEAPASSFTTADLIQADPAVKSSSSPDPSVLAKIIDREYPGFGFRVQK